MTITYLLIYKTEAVAPAPAILGEDMWKEGTLRVSNLVAVKWVRHSQPVAVHGKRDLRGSAFKVHHSHDDVTL